MNDRNRTQIARGRDKRPRARPAAAGRRARATAPDPGGGIRDVTGAKRQSSSERPRPPRREIEEAARDLVWRRGRVILATVRRYAANLDDAEDAYQRGLEILLTKAPTTHEVELARWLKTVVMTKAPTTHEVELARSRRCAGHTTVR
jgi:hypothetical protein